MVRVRSVFRGLMRAAVLLTALVLLSTYTKLGARLSISPERDSKKISHAYVSPSGEHTRQEPTNTTTSIQTAVIAPASHQRRRPPLAYSVRDMSFDERVKFQRGEIDSFCSQYNYTFPTNRRIAAALNRHILVHNEARLLLCFVPKAGCTTLKVLLFASQGLLPLSEVGKDKDAVDQLLLEDVMVRASFLRMTPEERERALATYFKFVMYRNPLERMVSVYRSKLSRWPLLGLKRDTPHFNWVRRHIFKHTHPDEYRLWEYDRGVVAKNVSFEDFVVYLLTDPQELRVDEHFAPTFELCSPCQVRYDYYGNFNTFEEDVRVVMKKVHSDPSHLRRGYYQGDDTTRAIMGRYIDQLSTDLKRKVLHFFAKELHVYYRLFPEEAGSHKDILGLEDDLPPL